MEEINPYAAPASGFADVALVSPRPFGYGMYKWCSLIYGVGFAIIGFFVAARGGLDASLLGMVVALVVLAPSISYLLVATRSRRLLYSWLPLHLWGLLMLVSFGVKRAAPEGGALAYLALFMIVSSLLSWLSSLYFHWRLGKK